MARFSGRIVTFAIAIILLCASWCGAMELLAPTDGQAVRERVKIQLPLDDVPDDGFISIFVGEAEADKFVVAIARDAAISENNVLTFFWNTKQPYYDSAQPMQPKYFKDGRYQMMVQAHDAKGKTVSSAKLTIVMKNQVDRPSPAPGIDLVNRMTFGQTNDYRVRCDVSVFEIVNRVGLPILGGMALSGEVLLTQSIEDVRPAGEFLIRLRTDEKTFVSSYGVKKYLYAGQELKPQLYRLVNKYGSVIKANMFSKQAKYRIMDILPVLSAGQKKEGDSWPDTVTLKIDGLTPFITLKGSAMLDSFEWEQGRECAKIKSIVLSETPISLANGKIKSTGPLNADVTTYFAYKSGTMLRRDIRLTFDAEITPDSRDEAGGQLPGEEGPDSLPGEQLYPFSDDDDIAPAPSPGLGTSHGATFSQGVTERGPKKGRVELVVVIRLEK
ncbi:MAG: hypothetical protein GX139_10525 [Armatimonadetes bacterium]|nr:hypothetical protein [Armatimonadota bacterium]